MDYNKILRNLSSVSIKTSELLKYFNINIVEMIDYYKLYELLKLFPERVRIESLNLISLTANGLYFDLANIKRYISSLLNIPLDENALKKLKQLDEKISKKGMGALKKRSKQLNKYYFAYIRGNIDPTKKSKYSFYLDIQRIINIFQELLLYETKFAKICEDSINEQALELFLAFKVMNYYNHCEERNLTKKMSSALTFLTKYLSDNIKLVKEDFAFNHYRIKKVYDFVSSKVTKKPILKSIKTLEELEEDGYEKYSYSFLECDISEAANTMHRILFYAEHSDNDESLKILLRRKIELYQSINYKSIKIGIDSFNGYLGFVLNNGYVILDKLFDNFETSKIAYNNAIYIIKEEDFDLVTKSSKSKVIKLINTGAIKAERIIHSGNYEVRIRAITKR